MNIEYPIVAISKDKWKDIRGFLYPPTLGHPDITSGQIVEFNKLYKDQVFCDCKGDLYQVVDLKLPKKWWQYVFGFLPGVYTETLIFEKVSNNHMSVDLLKSYLITYLTDMIPQNDIIPILIEDLSKANDHETLIMNLYCF